jgi:hypothetical protein
MSDPNAPQAAGEEALVTLRHMIADETVPPAARVSAAKALLDRFTPKEDAELKRREAEERDNAIAEARCLLVELAARASAGFNEPPALAEDGATKANHAANDSSE